MGNLLGSPKTDKETHVGTTIDSRAADGNDTCAVASSSPDGGGMEYGVSSMQGWRVHMEDAHIAQPFLYAEKLVNDSCGAGESIDGAASGASIAGADVTPCEKTAMETPEVVKGTVGTTATTSTNSRNNGDGYVHIALPNHSLFAVFDGHGGSFAAEYAARNLLRVLTRDATFCEYAEKWRGREAYRKVWQERNAAASAVDGSDHESGSEKADTLEFAMATYDQELVKLLEHSLRDAFMDLDAEILREVRGEKVPDANLAYGAGYDLSRHSLQGSENNHSPDEKALAATDSPKSNNNSNDCSTPPPLNTHHPTPHPTPTNGEDSGTTAVVVLVTPRWLVCANAGDSRAVYSHSSHCVAPLSYDHKPEDEGEERRIREAGGYISRGRVQGDLSVSRGLGDFRFKVADTVLSGARGERVHQRHDRDSGAASVLSSLQRNSNNQAAKFAVATIGGEGKEDVPMMRPSQQKVSPEPDIIVKSRNPTVDEFILVCCDGIWDVQTNQQCVKMVADIFEEGESNLGLVCEEILDLCFRKGSKDNMTAAVVKLPKQAVGKGGGVMARRDRLGSVSTMAASRAFSSSAMASMGRI